MKLNAQTKLTMFVMVLIVGLMLGTWLGQATWVSSDDWVFTPITP